MSYRILQFNLGSGRAQGYVLQGEGVYEGTNLNLTPREIDDALRIAEQQLLLRHFDYKAHRPSLLRDSPPPDQRLANALAEFLDRRFALAHLQRLAEQKR